MKISIVKAEAVGSAYINTELFLIDQAAIQTATSSGEDSLYNVNFVEVIVRISRSVKHHIYAWCNIIVDVKRVTPMGCGSV